MATESTEITELIADIREQVLYMQELGVEGMDCAVEKGELRIENAEAEIPSHKVATSRAAGLPEISNLRSEISKEPERPAGSRLAELPSLTKRKSPEFFDKYNPGNGATDVAKENMVPSPKSSNGGLGEGALTSCGLPQQMPEPTETIEQIRAEIGPDCNRCPLHTFGRKQVVNSVGNFNADLMFVGEAPGADEDIQGEPFVGKAGQLLTDIIEKGLQIPRQDVFIGNINRCRPPGNRTPAPEEAVVCKPFLLREIAVVRPKVIVVLGAHAAQTLLETKTPISKMRGHFHDLNGVKVMPTFHPAYLLRDPHKKREVWEDMKMVRDYLKT